MNGPIREARPSDIDAIERINHICFGYAAPREAARACLARADAEALILCFVENEETVGYLQAQILRPVYGEKTAYVHALAVLPEYRRRGIAGALLAQAEAWGRASGARGMALHSGVDRADAHAFYRAHGYALRKEQMHFIKPLGEEDGNGHTELD